ncbi:MAG: hypothetical protein JSS49_13745 [Planctomycetes bacterium]|nr:hypothetical protein [Planctomycetota bacterium]
MLSILDESKPGILATLSPSERTSIAVEANLLKLPLFALHTKGLKNLDGFECRGMTTRGENTWEFLFRTARSTATLYPGPLSRSVHLAFLGLITEQGLPFANPVTWTWRSLCTRLGVQSSGRMVRQLKDAIEATAGLTIFSHDALYSKPTGQRLNSRKAMHLYETVVFVNDTLPDGQMADTNYLWLSGWYLDNLNSLFTAPLDHELWRYLDKRSPIASRLYGWLLINFHGGAPQLKINYPKLAQFLPVRPERYLSDARKQMEPALQLLTQARVTDSVIWQKHPHDIAQLRFERGTRLIRSRSARLTEIEPLSATTSTLLDVREVRRSPEQELVSDFYRLWTGQAEQRPTSADLQFAKRLLAEYGRAKSKTLLPLVVDQLRRHWPGARTFVAAEQYLGTAAELLQSRQQHAEQRRELIKRQRVEREAEEQQRAERQKFEAKWEPIWRQLQVGEQVAIRDQVLRIHPFLRHAPHELQFRCLQKLAEPTKSSGETPGVGERDLRTARNPQL